MTSSLHLEDLRPTLKNAEIFTYILSGSLKHEDSKEINLLSKLEISNT